MPWIKEDKLYPIIALLLILIIAVRTPLDTDMWWHLRAGEETLHNREVYSVDTFSFTREGSDWINHSWLSQVVMILAYQGAGYYGLSIWVGICAGIAMLFIYLQMKGHPLLRSTVLLFAAVVASVVWSPRPQIHSLVLFSLTGYLIFKYKQKKDLRYLVFLPPVFALWGNLHGGYVLGIILLGSVFAGEILNKVLFKKFTQNLSWRELGLFAGFTLLSIIAVLINPFGLDMWKIPFNTVGVETLQNVINEWASPDFHQAFQQPMLWMMLGVFSLMGLSNKEIDGTELVPLAAFSWAALVARRNFGPFAIIAAPLFSKYLACLIEDWINAAKVKYPAVKKFIEKSDQSNKDLKPWTKNLVNSMILGLLLFGVIWKTVDVNRPGFIMAAEKETFPVEAVEWLEDSDLDGNLFNDYNWGGYLIWSLREIPVFVDGRTDLYGDEILEDYLSIMSQQKGWENAISEYKIGVVLVQAESGIARALINSGWKNVYEDSRAIIFKR